MGAGVIHAETPRPQSTSLVAATTAPVKSFAAEAAGNGEVDSSALAPRKTVAGFRMEGAPQLEPVFGDIAAYKARIDQFSKLHASMATERKRFATATHHVQVTLGPAKPSRRKRKQRAKRATCPTESIAKSVASAMHSHETFKMLGVQFERSFLAIRDLHQLGESAGLTPDYRGRVLQSRAAYQEALGDLGDMNAVMRLQVGPDLAKRGCTVAELVDYVSSQAGEEAIVEKSTPKTIPESTVVRARAVTFFVDNRTCSGGLDVYVDGALLGHVAGGTHAAFQSLSGRHALCLLDEGGVVQCGDTGTVRTAFVHDGFRLQRSCGEAE